MKPKEVVNLVGYISAIWPNFDVKSNPMVFQVWEKFLVEITFDQAVAFVDKYALDNHAFAPSPAMVRAAFFSDDIPSSDQALREVNEQIARVGYMGEPKFSHPAIGDAIKAITWKETCESDNPEAFRAHFFRIYENTRSRHMANQGATSTMKLVQAEKKELVNGN